MKLQELIGKLQTVEKSKKVADVAFQFVDVSAIGFTTRRVYLLDVSDEGAECLISVGNYEDDATTYKDHVETIKKQNVR
jgi:hypothetical protein